MFRHIIQKIAKMVRKAPAYDMVQGRGYYVTINGYKWRYEPTWRKANGRMRFLQRKKIRGWHVQMRRIHPQKGLGF